MLGEATFRVLTVIEPRRAVLLAVLPGSAARDADITEGTLCVPDDSEDALQLQVTITPQDDDQAGAAADRFTAYHGSGHKGVYTRLDIQAGKIAGVVLESADLPLTHPLAAIEPKLVKLLNTNREILHRAVCTRLGLTLHDTLAVGVDPRGIDIRAAEGVRRITFVKFAETQDVALARINDFLSAGV